MRSSRRSQMESCRVYPAPHSVTVDSTQMHCTYLCTCWGHFAITFSHISFISLLVHDSFITYKTIIYKPCTNDELIIYIVKKTKNKYKKQEQIVYTV